ncbi:MAG: type II toxin-antitoxin system VapC family toxin [Deltaproteobacteria bacterium]|nr:type II toxin-antitoxin system VapC family toxin [Deltaproteobacteria bacterium]
MIWIIDASVALRWFIEDEYHPNADKILRRIVDEPHRFAVPELFCFEVYSILQRVHPKALTAFQDGMLPLLQGGVFRQPMTEELAARGQHFVGLGLTGYDACYAALAQIVEGKWLTFDDKAHRLIKKEEVSWSMDKKLPPQW